MVRECVAILGQPTGHVLGKLDSDVYFRGYSLRLYGQPQSVNSLCSCPRDVPAFGDTPAHSGVAWHGSRMETELAQHVN